MSQSAMGKQRLCLKAGSHNTAMVSTMGMEHPTGLMRRTRREWERYQVCHDQTFSLVVLESYQAGADAIGYTKQEDYIKINFWLSGKHTTVLDGFGEYEHHPPEVFITAGPQGMIKADLLSADTQTAVVALCVLREFFPVQMGMGLDELPDPLRGLVSPQDTPYAFCQFPLTADLAAAARAILAAPFTLRGDVRYGRAKSVELMCLLINLMSVHNQLHGPNSKRLARQESRLIKARDLLTQRFAESITIDEVAKEIGLNRVALTAGFRRLFGTSIYDYIQKQRMERAFELLRDHDYTIARIAEAVGFNHTCNFSTAFHAYFGCTPRKARESGC